jgi:transcriptional regulator with XRE-family HTH domain
MKESANFEEKLQQIGYKLYMARHARREKMQTVAKAVGVSYPVISRIENGRYKGLSSALLFKLSDYYGISINEMI